MTVTKRPDRMTFVGFGLPALALGIGLVSSWHAFGADITIPRAYDHPFLDRMIVEQESLHEVLADGRCQHSWDVSSERVAFACSWHFDDPLNPGKQACHVVYPKIEDGVWSLDQAAEAVRIETANCNGWHDAEAHASSPLVK
jgi:hypothetical protein